MTELRPSIEPEPGSSESPEGGTRTSVLGVIADLLFETPIRHSASQIGLAYVHAQTADVLARQLDLHRPALVIVDMEIASQDPAAAIETCKAHAAHPTVIAYYPHVRNRLAKAAERAGADRVLPRSQFSSQLPSLLEQVKT